MLHRSIPQEEPCPVPESLLGQMYKANPDRLPALIESVSPFVRAMLAVYCRRRAHLAAIGLNVAATCEKDDLINAGGDFGAMLYEQARRTVGVFDGRASLLSGEGSRKAVAQDLI
jgi:hypothetical protein